MLKSANNRRGLKGLALAVASSLALSACMTATPYQPATGSGSYRTGYSDERIEENRFRVSFAGNSLTARDTVERYLLYRAAELTVQNGFDHFTLVDRDTETRTDRYRTMAPRPAWGGPFGGWGGYWSPSWRFYGGGFGGWRSYNPWYDDPFWGSSGWDYRTVTRYEAIAEIVTGRGRKDNNIRSFDAREVLNRLGPSIQMPDMR